MEKTTGVHWQLTPLKLQLKVLKVLLQWTPPGMADPIFKKTIQLQPGAFCLFIRMKVFKTHKEPQYIEIESDSSEGSEATMP